MCATSHSRFLSLYGCIAHMLRQDTLRASSSVRFVMVVRVLRNAVEGVASFFVIGALLYWLEIRHCDLDRLPPGDSGELIMAAASLVPPHPPGYPLFVWVYHAWSQLGSAWGMSMTLSSGVLTVTLVLLGWLVASNIVLQGSTVRPLHRILIRAVFVAASCASPQSVRDLLTQTEVFALHWCLCAVLCAAAASGNVVAFAVIAALCGANQHTSVFAVVPLSIGCCCLSRRRGPLRLLAAGASACAVVLVLYESLLWLHVDDAYAWGHLCDQRTLWRHVLRVDYGTFQLHSGRGMQSNATISRELWSPSNAVFWEWLTSAGACGYVAVALALTGVVNAVRRLCVGGCGLLPVPLTCSLAAWGALGSVACFNSMINLPLQAPSVSAASALHFQVVGRLWAHVWLPLSLLAAEGAWGVMHAYAARCQPQRRTTALAVLVGLVAFAWPLPGADDVTMHHQARAVHDAYATSLLSTLPHGAIIVTAGDQALTSLRHAQRARSLRPDVVHVDRETSSYAWYHQRHLRRPDLHRTISWPNATQDGDTFVDLVALAALNINTRRMFVLEDKELAAQGPALKVSHSLVFGENGWLYEITPRHKVEKPRGARCDHDAATRCSSGVMGRWLPKGLRLFECLLQNANTSWRWANVVARCSPPTRSNNNNDVVPLLRSNVRTMSRHHPWEALVVQQYHLSVKHSLLQAAETAQTCCAAPAGFAKVLAAIRREARHRLRPEYFTDDATYESSVAPFLALIDQTLDSML